MLFGSHNVWKLLFDSCTFLSHSSKQTCVHLVVKANLISVSVTVQHSPLKTSRVYCSKRRDQTGSFQSHHSFKRGCTHGCIRKFTIHIYIACYSYSPHPAKLQTPFNQCTSHETNGEKTRKEVLVLDVGGKPQRISPLKTHAVMELKTQSKGRIKKGR